MIKTGHGFLTVLFILTVGTCYAQDSTLLTRQQSDSLPHLLTDTDSCINKITPSEDPGKLNAARYFALLGGNFKEVFAKPFHMKKRDWKYFSITAGIFGTLSFQDESVQRFSLQWRNKSSGMRNTSGIITRFGDDYGLYTMGVLGAYSFLFKKERMRTVTLLASQAYITSAVIASALKFATVRTRPSFYKPPQEAEPYFLGPFVTKEGYNGARTSTSFPSGHTASAFAMATVFAKEYRDRPWIPVVAYGAATLVGLSRIAENKHWATDVFAGAALGYITGLQAVNNYHRYSATKLPRKKKRLSFSLQYSHGYLMPGLVYKM
jgi:membrane-associated phospholipid phosphatase